MLNFCLEGIEDLDDRESIARCLRNLYSTPAGTIPCDRDFGLSWAGLDMIPENMEAVYGLELLQKTDQYEPRIKATGVDFVHLEDGTVTVTVDIKARREIGNG